MATRGQYSFTRTTGRQRIGEVKSFQSILTRQIARQSYKGIGLKLDSDEHGYEYNIHTPSMNTDPFIRKAMKQWDYELYDGQRGYTKAPNTAVGIKDFFKYDKPEASYSTLEKSDMFSHYTKACDKAMKEFSPENPLPMLLIEDACDALSRSTAAGFSWPGETMGDVADEVFDVSRYMIHQVRRGYPIWIPPAKLAFRGHLSPLDQIKTRPVWVYPKEISLIENIWGKPYYDWLETNCNSVMFGKKTMVNLRKRLTEALLFTDCEVSLDWSMFDKNVPNFLTDVAFQIIHSSFRKDCSLWTSLNGEPFDMKVKNWNRVFSFVQGYFKYTRVMTPDGNIYRKMHGVPSGSNFTQAVDSICNYIAVNALTSFVEMLEKDLKVLGDDSSFRTESRGISSKLVDLAIAAKQFFGFVLNLDKIVISDRVQNRTFIGYQIDGSRLYRPTEEWLKRALYSEYDVKNLTVSASRMYGLYMIGGCNDPVFSSFFLYFFGVYPDVIGRKIPMSRETQRLSKYVFHIEDRLLSVPDPRGLDFSLIPFKLVMDNTVTY